LLASVRPTSDEEDEQTRVPGPARTLEPPPRAPSSATASEPPVRPASAGSAGGVGPAAGAGPAGPAGGFAVNETTGTHHVGRITQDDAPSYERNALSVSLNLVVQGVAERFGAEAFEGPLPVELPERLEPILRELATRVASSRDAPLSVSPERLMELARDELLELGPLGDLLADTSVTEIGVVRFDQVASDRQSETEATVATDRAAVRLTEAIEDIRKKLRRDADARVLHLDDDGLVLIRAAHVDASAGGSELHRVRQHVAKHLVQPFGVAIDDGKIGRAGFDQLDVLRLRRRYRSADDRVDERREQHRRMIDLELAADDARHIEDVFNQTCLQVRIAADDIDGVTQPLRRDHAGLEHLHPSEDGVQRGPQFV